MLYVSTRNKQDAYTAHRALCEGTAVDGGCYAPFRLPVYAPEYISGLVERSFGQIVADVLNTFFSTGLTAWNVEIAIGRSHAKIISLGRRTAVCELWHNPGFSYNYLEQSLYGILTGTSEKPTGWARIAIAVATLFGLFSDLLRAGAEEIDIAETTGDLTLPLAAFYARKMGLPVGRIICSCDEGSAFWDLIQRGERDTANCASMASGLERLVFETLGLDGVNDYLTAFESKGLYALEDEQLSALADGFNVSAVGAERIDTVISSIQSANDYTIDPVTAHAFGGLQDYRARTGENRTTVLLARSAP